MKKQCQLKMKFNSIIIHFKKINSNLNKLFILFNFINFKRIIRFNLKKNEKKIKNFNKTS